MLKLNRRSFLKAALAAGSAASAFNLSPDKLSGLAEAQAAPKEEERKIRTICRGCGKYECSVFVVMKNGRPVKIVGDDSAFSSFGNCCTKGQASIHTCLHPDRLIYPMKRTRPRGQEAGWVRISWKEAIKACAKGLSEVKAKYGADAIWLQHGTSRITSYSVQNLVQGLGSCNVGLAAGQVCKGPRYWASAVTYFRGGGYMTLNDGVDCFVQWGANTEMSNYDNCSAGTIRGRYNAKKHIMIGPRLQNLTAAGNADYWLPVRPGTDGALAMSWIKMILDGKKYDKAFLAEWSNASFLYAKDIEPTGFVWAYKQGMVTPNGIEPLNIKTRLVKESDMVKGGSPRKFAFYDNKSKKIMFFDAEKVAWPNDKFSSVEPALNGTFDVKLANGKTVRTVTVLDKLSESVARYTPEYAGQITGVDPKLIRDACETFSSFKSGGAISTENGLEHAGNCIQALRSVYLLGCLMNNIDTKGGYRGGDDNICGHSKVITYNVAPAVPDTTPAQRAKTAGSWNIPLMAWGHTMYSAPAIGDLTTISDMALNSKPYPLRAVVGCTGSFTQNANSCKNYEAYKSLDFACMTEIFITPTAELADILMPSAHWLENETVRVSQGAGAVLGAQTGPMQPPRGEAQPDQVTMVKIMEELKIPYWPKEWGPVWPSLTDMNNKSIEPLQKDLGIKTWADFKAKFQKEGTFDYNKISPKEWSYKRYEKGLFRHDGRPGFPTPTTRIELLATILESYHPGDELPVYREPLLSAYTDDGKRLRDQGYNITLITGARSPVYFHSEQRMVPHLRELHLLPKVQINPELAEKIGVKQGDWVWIESHKGRIRQTVDIFAGIAPDVASADHAWYYPELPGPDHGWQYSNVNVLVDDKYKDPIIGANLLKTYPVKIYKAAEGAPEGIITDAGDPRLKKWLPKTTEK